MIKKFFLITIQILITTISCKYTNHINFRNTPIDIFQRAKLLFDDVVVNDYTNNNNNTRNGNSNQNNSDQDENEDLDIISTQVVFIWM